MTTVAQVKVVTKPLLERNDDLALVGRLVVIKPVHHLLRGVYMDRSSDPSIFQPTWFVTLLFAPHADVHFDWGERVYNRGASGQWKAADPATPHVMCEEIEKHALPLLRPVQTIDDFVAFASRERFRWTCLDDKGFSKAIVDVACGNFESAEAFCTEVAATRAKNSAPDMPDPIHLMTETLSRRDRPGLARLLHAWEAASAKRLKLEEFWEPTPFPIEL
jgi:hypothetical protein